jgi:hypothetical protein
MILNHLLNNENESGRALRIAHRCEAHTEACSSSRRRLSHRGSIEGQFIWRLCKLTQSAYARHLSCWIANYAEFDKIFMAGIARLMGKNIPKSDKTNVDSTTFISPLVAR